MKTQSFRQAIRSLAHSSTSIANIDLLKTINDDGLLLDEAVAIFEHELNELMLDKNLVLDGTKHNETALFARFKKALQRHNTAILWTAFRDHVETDSEAAQILGHISLTQKGLEWRDQHQDFKHGAYTTLTQYPDSLIGFSVKRDTKLDQLVVNTPTNAINPEQWIARYNEWKQNLPDYIPAKPTKDTTPSVTLTTDGNIPETAHLLKQVRDAESQHAIDVAQIVSDKKEIGLLEGKIEALTEERDQLQKLVDDLERQLAFIHQNRPKARKRA